MTTLELKKEITQFLKEKEFHIDEKKGILIKKRNPNLLVSLTRFVPDYEIPIDNLFGREKVTIKINRNVFDRWLEEKNCIEIIDEQRFDWSD